MNEATKPLDAPHFFSVTPPEGTPQMQATAAPLPTAAQDAEMLRRIQACVDACEGISTEELEQGVIQDMQRVLKEVAPIVAEWSQGQQQSGQAN